MHIITVDGGGQLAGLDGVLGDVLVGTGLQRYNAIQELATPLDDLVTANLVVTGALLLAVLFRDSVGAVQSVVQGTPAGVRRVQREAGVQDRHHQLRAAGRADLWVDVLGRNLEVARLVDQVADLLQEGLVLLRILSTLVLGIPGIHLLLQLVASVQQLTVTRGVLLDDLAEAIPELLLLLGGILADGGKHLSVNKIVESLGNLKAAGSYALGLGHSDVAPHISIDLPT